MIQFKLLKRYNLNTIVLNYWDHNPTSLEEINQSMMLHNWPIPTYIRIIHNKQDIVVKDKMKQKCYIIEVGFPFDNNVVTCEREKNWNTNGYSRGKMLDINDIAVISITVEAMGDNKNDFEWTCTKKYQ